VHSRTFRACLPDFNLLSSAKGNFPDALALLCQRRRVMEHIAAFMILIACSDDLQACNEIPAPAVAYETVQECEAELTPAMRTISAVAGQVLRQMRRDRPCPAL
jgi:hypothetical protein